VRPRRAVGLPLRDLLRGRGRRGSPPACEAAAPAAKEGPPGPRARGAASRPAPPPAHSPPENTRRQTPGNGQFAPGINYGDSGRYACGHNLLLAHAAAAGLYKSKYAPSQGGRLSFTTLITWAEPASGSPEDAAAAQAKLDAEVGWFLDPIFKGDYPASLRAAKGAALPRFTPAQAAALRGSLGFVAANCFTAKWVWAPGGGGERRGAWREGDANPGNGTAAGAASGISWIKVAPWSQGRAWRYLQRQYGDPQVRSYGGGGSTGCPCVGVRAGCAGRCSASPASASRRPGPSIVRSCRHPPSPTRSSSAAAA
jgi:hypothetical protein